MMELVKCIDVNKKFDNKEILKNVNLTIPRGKIIGLLGKNGTGKSTLIKLINDLLTPTSGEILVNGKKVGVDSKKIISYLPERTYLDKTIIDKYKRKYADELSKKYILCMKNIGYDNEEIIEYLKNLGGDK